MPRDPNSLTGRMTPVQYTVWSYGRLDAADAQPMITELTDVMRLAFNGELTTLNYGVGCYAKWGNLTNSSILNQLRQLARTDAANIVNTFNYDLAAAIIRIGQANPRGNQSYYAAHLRDWLVQRKEAKDSQIKQHSRLLASSLAQRHFKEHNTGLLKRAHLEPKSAVCPICQGWIRRGEVPAYVAVRNPTNFHPNCPHEWVYQSNKVAPEACGDLWNGE